MYASGTCVSFLATRNPVFDISQWCRVPYHSSPSVVDVSQRRPGTDGTARCSCGRVVEVSRDRYAFHLKDETREP